MNKILATLKLFRAFLSSPAGHSIGDALELAAVAVSHMEGLNLGSPVATAVLHVLEALITSPAPHAEAGNTRITDPIEAVKLAMSVVEANPALVEAERHKQPVSEPVATA